MTSKDARRIARASNRDRLRALRTRLYSERRAIREQIKQMESGGDADPKRLARARSALGGKTAAINDVERRLR